MIWQTLSRPDLVLAMLLASAPLDHAPARHVDYSDSCVRRDRTVSATRELLRCGRSVAQLTPPRSQEPATNLAGGWRLVRTPDPRGGSDVIALSHTADLLRSDAEFAGITLRCSSGTIDVLFVLVRPLPPRSRPQVTINFETKTARFEAAVVPPGVTIRLPAEATALAGGDWQSVRELSVAIDDGESGKINGVVPLEGLRSAYATLVAVCASN